MRVIAVLALIASGSVWLGTAARSQFDNSTALVVSTCGTIPAGSGYTAGNFVALTVDTTGKLCQ